MHHEQEDFLPCLYGSPRRYRWMVCQDRTEIDQFAEGINERIEELLNERQDYEFMKFLHDAWYHTMPSELLEVIVAQYSRKHEIESERLVAALMVGFSFTPLQDDEEWEAVKAFKLHYAVMQEAEERLKNMLESRQGEEPCGCSGCIAEVAAQN